MKEKTSLERYIVGEARYGQKTVFKKGERKGEDIGKAGKGGKSRDQRIIKVNRED